MMNRRVVVTGTGLLSPVGLDVESTWSALVDGVSGAAPITQFDASEYPVRFACEVKDFEPTEYMDRKEVRRTDRFLQFALATAAQAMAQADVEEACSRLKAERFGVIVGSGIGGLATMEQQHNRSGWRTGPSRTASAM
jgi:3-oxoacyl-[acyl-carrier-protein] synthase II